MRLKSWRNLLLFLGCMTWGLVAAPTAAAQRVAGIIFGTVSDSTGARLPGVSVTVASPQLLGGQQVRATGAEGTYRFVDLPPGTYTLSFEIQGFEPQKREGILLLAGQSLTVAVQLPLAGVAEAVTVTSEVPLIDTRTSGLVNFADPDTLENVPYDRDYTKILNLLPGVIDANYNFSPINVVHGGSVRQNEYSLDGIYTNDSLTGATSTQLSVDTIQEIQLTTAGITAEYGDASGAVFNYITKSGGDRFSGGASFYFQNRGTEADNVSDDLRAQGLTVASGFEHVYDLSGFLGGPIKRERAWFFANYRYQDLQEIKSDFPVALGNTEKQLFVKGTVKLGDSNTLMGSYHRRVFSNFPFTATASFRNADDPRTWMALVKTNRIPMLQWTSVISDSTLLQVRGALGYYHIPVSNPNNDGSTAYVDQSTGIISGGDFHTIGRVERNRHQARADLTHFKENWAGGSHEFKTGIKWMTTPNLALGFLQGARGSNELTGCSEACISQTPDVHHLLFNGDPFRVRLYNSPSDRNHKFDIWNVYFQDQWVLGERLTLNLGVRYDHSSGTITESSVGGGAFEPLQTFPEQNGLITFDNVAPRLGVVWDATGSNRTTIKGSAGRFYSQPLAAWLDNINPAVLAFREFDWEDRNGDRVWQQGEETLLRTDTRPDPTAFPTADPNLKNQYTDVYTIGFQHLIGEEWVLSATGIFKRDGDLIGFVNDAVPISAYQPITVTNPLTGQPLDIFTLPTEFLGRRPAIRQTNPGDRPGDPAPLTRQYNGVEVVLNKRMSNNWQLSTSYVLGRGSGTVSNGFAGSTWADYTNPNFFINRDGDLAMDRRHQFKLQATYKTDYGLLFSGFLEVLSGFPITNNYQGFNQESPRGATEVRVFQSDFPQILSETFIDVAGEPAGTRTFDVETLLDLRVQYRIPVGGDAGVALIADIFNVFNSGTVIRLNALRLDDPRYLTPAELLKPRVLRMGIRFDF
jgi:outer membrane receptor protein involved in Fe transport